MLNNLLHKKFKPSEAIDEQIVAQGSHHVPDGLSDYFAFGFTKALRCGADTFFAKRYGHRAIVLETVAAVLGMVGATIQQLNSLMTAVGFAR